MSDLLCGLCHEMFFSASDYMKHRSKVHPEIKAETAVTYLPAEMPKLVPPPIEAVKHDQGKPDLSMISYEMVELVARVREFGAKKYARNNWKKGFKITRSCAAALRHIFLFLSGETNDPESGLSHLGHAVCCLEHAVYDMKHHPLNDDRNGE